VPALSASDRRGQIRNPGLAKPFCKGGSERACSAELAERARSAELAEARKLMFHELQHRVSNNLSAVASLPKRQQRGVADPAAKRWRMRWGGSRAGWKHARW
jgi:hypothetical protein